MRQSLLIIPALFVTSACTQPAVVVDNRGMHDFSQGRGGYEVSAAAPIEMVSQSAPIESAPIEVATISNQSVAVSDLAPAAGKVESAPINQWTEAPRDAVKDTAKIAEKGPYIWPVDSREVISEFGPKGSGKVSDGITIAAKKGEPVWAVADGEVVYADKKLKGYGNMVIVKHKGGKTSSYAHLARMGVEKYDRIKQGDIIGYVGVTGGVDKPQLYFSVREGTKAVDPQKYLAGSVAGL